MKYILTLIFIMIGLNFTYGYHSIIKYGKYSYNINTYTFEENYILNNSKSLTRALDLLAIRTMECNRKSGFCNNGADIGPFQINRIHKTIYYNSYIMYKNKESKKLFLYQLKYANTLLDYYEKKYCSWKKSYLNKNNNETTNDYRFRCIYKHYNGTWKRTYLSLKKRQMVKKFIINKYYKGIFN